MLRILLIMLLVVVSGCRETVPTESQRQSSQSYPISTPEDTTAVEWDSVGVNWDWRQPVTGGPVSAYEVQLSTNNSQWERMTITVDTSAIWISARGDSIRARVRGINALGTGPWSDPSGLYIVPPRALTQAEQIMEELDGFLAVYRIYYNDARPVDLPHLTRFTGTYYAIEEMLENE